MILAHLLVPSIELENSLNHTNTSTDFTKMIKDRPRFPPLIEDTLCVGLNVLGRVSPGIGNAFGDNPPFLDAGI